MAPRHRSSFDSFSSGESSRRSNTPRRNEDASRPQASAARSYSRAAYGDTGTRQRAASYSRDSTQAEYARIRAKKKRRKIIGGVVGALLAVLLVGGGVALAYMGFLNGKLNFGIDDETRGALVDKSLSEPFYMLLMGTDKSEDRDASGEFGDSYRSDSMMLARIDPQQKKVTLVSIERDTLVDIDGYGINKINAAYALGGPSLAVKTVSEFAGVPISHYAEINFDGFKAVVDALGGVDVNVSIDINDPEAGGSLSAGEQTINGDQALILCRSRHAYEDAGYGGGDYYRAANQRMVLGAIAKKLLASDPATMASTITALCDYITTDMSVSDIAAVANSMRGMDPSTDIYSTMNPTTSSYEDGVWCEYSNNEAWAAMMKRIDQGLSPTPDESASMNNGGVTDGSIGGEAVAQAVLNGEESSLSDYGHGEQVEVQNGSGVSGVAATAASTLTNKGYDVTNTLDADSYNYSKTLVIYDKGTDESVAKSIAKLLGCGIPTVNDGSYTYEGSYLVIVGKDYKG